MSKTAFKVGWDDGFQSILFGEIVNNGIATVAGVVSDFKWHEKISPRYFHKIDGVQVFKFEQLTPELQDSARNNFPAFPNRLLKFFYMLNASGTSILCRTPVARNEND